MVLPMIYCWIDNVKLYYNKKTRTTTNTPGVETRIPGWGDPEVVEWIDPTKNKAGAYFKDIANVLIDLGYERRHNILGAPYDFRRAPSKCCGIAIFYILLFHFISQMKISNSLSI